MFLHFAINTANGLCCASCTGHSVAEYALCNMQYAVYYYLLIGTSVRWIRMSRGWDWLWKCSPTPWNGVGNRHCIRSSQSNKKLYIFIRIYYLWFMNIDFKMQYHEMMTATGTSGISPLNMNIEMNNMRCAYHCRKYACRNVAVIYCWVCTKNRSRKATILFLSNCYQWQIIHFGIVFPFIFTTHFWGRIHSNHWCIANCILFSVRRRNWSEFKEDKKTNRKYYSRILFSVEMWIHHRAERNTELYLKCLEYSDGGAISSNSFVCIVSRNWAEPCLLREKERDSISIGEAHFHHSNHSKSQAP